MALSPKALLGLGLGSLVGVSCGGLLGNDSDKDCAVRDPAMGFVEGPSIEVCWDGKRVVPAARARGGPLSLCVAGSSAAQSCETDTSCSKGERCLCGQCVTDACRDSTECGAQEICQGSHCTHGCTTDRDCAPYETCFGGGCARKCGRDADCAHGEKCSALDGTCIVQLCGPTISCGEGDTCVQQEQVADLREPQLLRWKEQTLAYFELRTGTSRPQCAIYRARIDSARRWEVDPLEPVLSPADDDSGCIGAPSLLEAEQGLSLYGAKGDGSGLIRAHSVDGVHFEREPGVLWTAQWPWEKGWVGSPAAARWNHKVFVFYEAGPREALGLLELDAAGGATPVTTEPWLRPSDLQDPTFWRSVTQVSAPFALVRDEVLLLYLTGRGAEGSDAIEPGSSTTYPADRNDSIGLIALSGPDQWERFPTGPVFARRTNLRAYLGEREPSVLITESDSWLVFVGSDSSGQLVTGLSLAQSRPTP